MSSAIFRRVWQIDENMCSWRRRGLLGAIFWRAIERRNLIAAESAAREIPNLPLAYARALVHLYADKRDRRFERAALRYLEGYLSGGSEPVACGRGRNRRLAGSLRGASRGRSSTMELRESRLKTRTLLELAGMLEDAGYDETGERLKWAVRYGDVLVGPRISRPARDSRLLDDEPEGLTDLRGVFASENRWRIGHGLV
jgi:hypothetical protein